MLKYSNPLLLNCMICGTHKNKSIENALKNKQIQATLYDWKSDIDDHLQCDDETDISKCKGAEIILTFVRKYNDEHHIKYVNILNKLNQTQTHELIISKSIRNISDYYNEQSALLSEIFECKNEIELNLISINDDPNHNALEEKHTIATDEESPQNKIKFNGNDLCFISEDEFISRINKINAKISFASIKAMYRAIFKECDRYVLSQQYKLYNAPYEEIVRIWRHVFRIHLDDDIYDTYSYFVSNIEKCSKSTCIALSRNARHITSSSDGKYREYNEIIQQKELTDNYYQMEFDAVHCNIMHTKYQRQQVKGNIKESMSYYQRSQIQLSSESEYNDDLETNAEIELVQMDIIDATHENDDDNHRYITDIELYGFGIDHNHINLGPRIGNGCMKTELLNTDYFDENQWNDNLICAFNKFKYYFQNKEYIAKQYNTDYNILRGDPLGVHHIYSILVYTKYSNLCTEYRSCFRRIHPNETNKSITYRHSQFYFFSRFIYESIEFYGDIMGKDQIVYHGLNQPFLFSHFSTHFNAPTSTTTDWHIANGTFARGTGIVLTLKNGNRETQNDVIALYSKYQPRYIDVREISPHTNESELLFYGDNVMFEIADIEHHDRSEIQKGTLRELNLLQRVIKNKEMDWNTERKKKKQLKKLQKSIKETRKMNIEINKNTKQGLDGFHHLLQTNGKPNNEYHNVMKYVNDEEYDTDALYADIVSDMNQYIESNLCLELNADNDLMETIERYLYFTNTQQIFYLKSTLSQAMDWSNFVDFISKSLSHSTKFKQNEIVGFIAYCKHFQISGKQFENVDGELMSIWMNEKHLYIGSEMLYSMIYYLKNELESYDYNISKTIQNSEKLNTQKYDVKYYQKLYHYFCISQRDFICFRSIHEMPDILLHVLLFDDKGKLSITTCTDLFSNVEHIAFNELSMKYLLSKLSAFCKSVIGYSQNEEENKYKRLRLVTVRSVDLPHSKQNVILKQMIQEYQSKTTNIKMNYSFQFERNHVIEFKIRVLR